MSGAKLKFERDMLKEAKRRGVTNARIERTKDHPVLMGEANGKAIRMIFSGASTGPTVRKSCFNQLKKLCEG